MGSPDAYAYWPFGRSQIGPSRRGLRLLVDDPCVLREVGFASGVVSGVCPNGGPRKQTHGDASRETFGPGPLRQSSIRKGPKETEERLSGPAKPGFFVRGDLVAAVMSRSFALPSRRLGVASLEIRQSIVQVRMQKSRCGQSRRAPSHPTEIAEARATRVLRSRPFDVLADKTRRPLVAPINACGPVRSYPAVGRRCARCRASRACRPRASRA